MLTISLKFRHLCCLFLFLGVLHLNAQKNIDPNLPAEQVEKKSDGSLNRSPRSLMANREQGAYLSEWMRSPYLKVPIEKATVSDITFAFEEWKKAHPEEMSTNRLHRDDEVVKFHRQLYRMQMENANDEIPINVHEKLEAFIKYDKENPHEVVKNFNNPDANWRSLGPNVEPIGTSFYEVTEPTNISKDKGGIGRINCIEFSIYDTKNIWVGTSTGGVWKTWNGGQTWVNISETLPIAEISDIAIDQSNSNVIYLATGDRDGQGGWYGNGIGSRLYKTTDGGNNWFPITANFGTGAFIEGLWTHPNRPWEVIVAKTNGFYKSVDGGATWRQTLTTAFAPPFSAPNNLRFEGVAYANLTNPERLYTAHFIVYDPETFEGAYQLRRSDDFGSTWQMMDSVKAVINDHNFLTNIIKIAIAPSDANTLYIMATEFDTVTNADRFGALMRTTDGGKTWENRSRYPQVGNIMGWLLGDSSDVGSQSFYDKVLTIDPKNKDRVYVDGVDMWGSTDGGKTFNKTTFWVNSLGESVHADHHWGEYQPISGDYFLATDGGLYKTSNLTPGDNSKILRCRHNIDDFNTMVTTVFNSDCYTFPTKWEFVGNGISNADLYAVAVSKSNPSMILIGTQDNSALMRREGKWYSVGGPWDCFEPMIHPTNPNIYYTSVFFGRTFRTNDGGKTYREIAGAVDAVDGGEWLTPMELHEASPNIITQARNFDIWRSTNGGDTWQKISNFTRGQSNRASAMAVAPSNANTIYAARFTQNQGAARVYYLNKTTDGGVTWKNIISTAFPASDIRDIAVHPTDPNKVWVSFFVGYNAANVNQSRKVFYSDNGGTTWTNISAGLPPAPAFTIVAPGNSPVGAVYVGTGFGIYYKDNTMAQFVEFQRGMPRGMPVVDLKIHEGIGKIYAATYGRGVWSANLYDQPYDGGVVSLQRDRSLLLNVYPNPAQDFIRVEWDDKNTEGQTLSIMDLHGRTIYTQADFKGRTTFDMSLQAAGIYTVQLKSGKEVLSKKFVLAK
jgi:photosystem II stability/assembly factor-like uncharacterized protein